MAVDFLETTPLHPDSRAAQPGVARPMVTLLGETINTFFNSCGHFCQSADSMPGYCCACDPGAHALIRCAVCRR